MCQKVLNFLVFRLLILLKASLVLVYGCLLSKSMSVVRRIFFLTSILSNHNCIPISFFGYNFLFDIILIIY